MGRRAPSEPAAAVKTIDGLGDLSPDARNTNDGTPRGQAMVENSVRRYGYARSVVADRQGRIIAGNKTLQAATSVGAAKVRVVQTTGDELVVVQRTDLDLDTDVAAQELAVADNRSSEVGLLWNAAQLVALEAAGGDLGQFFRPPEWSKIQSDADATALSEPLPEMEIQPFEHHDYLMVVFDNSQDWSRACEVLQIDRVQVTVAGGTTKVGIGRVIRGARLLQVLDEAAGRRAS